MSRKRFPMSRKILKGTGYASIWMSYVIILMYVFGFLPIRTSTAVILSVIISLFPTYCIVDLIRKDR